MKKAFILHFAAYASGRESQIAVFSWAIKNVGHVWSPAFRRPLERNLVIIDVTTLRRRKPFKAIIRDWRKRLSGRLWGLRSAAAEALQGGDALIFVASNVCPATDRRMAGLCAFQNGRTRLLRRAVEGFYVSEARRN